MMLNHKKKHSQISWRLRIRSARGRHTNWVILIKLHDTSQMTIWKTLYWTRNNRIKALSEMIKNRLKLHLCKMKLMGHKINKFKKFNNKSLIWRIKLMIWALKRLSKMINKFWKINFSKIQAIKNLLINRKIMISKTNSNNLSQCSL